MFFAGSQEQFSDHLLHDASPDPIPPPAPSCSKGHRSTLCLRTHHGGTLCLLCFSDLVSDPRAPTVHVSYALSQLSLALSEPLFLRGLLSSHAHFLVSPLVHALSSFEDAPIANQVVDIVRVLCSAEISSFGGDFLGRVADQLSSGALAWSRRQLHMLHCFGVLMNCKNIDIYAQLRGKFSLASQLVEGLQLPSEEIRGEILFVLYKLAALQFLQEDADGADVISSLCPKLLYLSLEALAKTQRDDVRLNCVALLTIMAQLGLFANSHAYSSNSSGEGDDPMQTADTVTEGPRLDVLFAEAIKGPLLSTDSQVQISTLDLIFHYVSQESMPNKQIQLLVEENIADYVFEILRLTECKDPVVNSCLRILDLFYLSEHVFRQRLVVGFPSVLQVFHYVASVPFHPFQVQTLKLIWSSVSDFPGIASSSQVKDIVLLLSRMLERYYSQEMGLLPDAFKIICSILVALVRTPSFAEISDVVTCLQESLRHAVWACLGLPEKDSTQILHAVYLLSEVHAYCSESSSISKLNCTELRRCIIDVCTSHLLPWFLTAVHEIKEEATLGIMETFHSILLQYFDIQVVEFANALVSAAWFSFSFGCLGYFSTDHMRQRVYLMLSSLVDILLGDKMGQPIRDAAPCLPPDPKDLLFLLGQDSSNNPELSTCQPAVLLIFHTSSLHNDRLADDKLVLAALEQYILVNRTSYICELSDSLAMLHLVNLYGICRSRQRESYQISYSLEAERIIFHLLNESNWDLCSCDIHLISFKWLFQQENITKGLTHQIRNISQKLVGNELHNVHGQRSFVRDFAELVSEGDNYGATLLVHLLAQHAGKEDQENGLIPILNLMIAVICIAPTSSDQLSLQGVGSAIQRLFCGSTNSSSGKTFTTLLLLMFNILASVQPEVLRNDESWFALTIKLLNYFSMQGTVLTQNHETLIMVGILCLVLNHSSSGALLEASKSIVLSPVLASKMHTVVDAACSKGPALGENYHGTDIGNSLAFVLLLSFFTMKSLQAVLPAEAVDWQNFFGPSENRESLPVIGVYCHDLCRLMHFGSPVIKLIASYCLLELFTELSEHITAENERLRCSLSYIKSVKAVLVGLIFYEDIRVAINSALCLSIILGLEDMEMEERGETLTTSSWYRLIAEKMSVYLAVPCLPSKVFITHHKPAIYVTVALLKLRNKPGWLRNVLDESCVSRMIQNLTPTNISSEIVLLFREFRRSQYLNTEQIAMLNHIFLASRKQMHRSETQNETVEERAEGTICSVEDHGEICNYLIGLMISESLGHTNPNGSHSQKNRLSDEIEQFFKSVTNGSER
ncbi:PREDICTED: protein PRD1 [Tarenaya hassleriana]|uniref:protein PRD1 n=1 Tax=Tarenaya hassleriana TaxID=28532 RepID=UPI00053C32EF|nr:PREDICTED: protein PRD1 [Tarenaya hassleriana]